MTVSLSLYLVRFISLWDEQWFVGVKPVGVVDVSRAVLICHDHSISEKEILLLHGNLEKTAFIVSVDSKNSSNNSNSGVC